MATSPPHHYSYALVYSSDEVVGDGYQAPIVPASELGRGNNTPLHGLPRDLKAILPALWYCLHLPRTAFDYRFVPATAFIGGRQLDLPQQIIFTPSVLLKNLSIREAIGRTDLLFCPEALIETVKQHAPTLQNLLAIVATEKLSEATLAHHWTLLAARARRVDDGYMTPPRILASIRLATTLLPSLFLARNTQEAHLVDERAEDDPAFAALALQFLVQLAAEEQGAPDSPSDSQRSRIQVSAEEHFSVPISFVAAGTSPTYRKAVGLSLTQQPGLDDAVWAREGLHSTDEAAEDMAIDFLAAHRALAQDGIAYRLPDIPSSLWRKLAELEKGYDASKPRKMRKGLDAVGSSIGELFDDAAIELAKRASRITCFSNFPVGLAVLPGTSAPLSSIRPFTYRPLMPLVRAMQMQCTLTGTRYWKRGLKVLVAECLDSADPIRPLSEGGWRLLVRSIEAMDGASARLVFPRNVEGLRDVLLEDPPHALILSAHGLYHRASNIAGVVVGNDFMTGLELDWVPEAVFLSACQVAPRGTGTVSIADLLMRAGAQAVLATQVPVDVRRNAMLMVRIFANVHAAMSGELPLRTLLDVWHHTASSNAVNDILSSNRSLREWATQSTPSGLSVVQDFMLRRSPGRLRSTHIYDDTITVLEEIADEMNFADKLRAILSSQGYLPETLLYHIVGWPERIVMKDETLDAVFEDVDRSRPTETA